MKIPDKIKICGIKTDIVFKRMQDPSLYGMYVYQDSKIYLNNDGTDRQVVEQSFIHEILHAINHALGITKDILNEEKVSGMSRALYQVLKDNKLLKD